MNLKKHNFLFFIIVCVVAFVLFKTTTIYKTTYYHIDFTLNKINHLHVNLVLIIYFSILNIFLHKKQFLKVTLYVLITSIISCVLAIVSFTILMKLLEFLDQKRTPLGWQFNYIWFTMIFLSIYLIISTNWIYKRMNRKLS